MGDGSRLISISSADHHDALIGGLWNLCASHCGLDFDLQWGGQSVRAHRIVTQVFLSLGKFCSNSTSGQTIEIENHYRHQVENGKALDHNQHQHPDGATDTLDCLLEFVYRGRTTVREDHLERLLEAAKDFDFQMLVDAVERTRSSDCVIDTSATTRTAVELTDQRQRKVKSVKKLSASRDSVVHDSIATRKPRVARSKKMTPASDDGSSCAGESDTPLGDAVKTRRGVQSSAESSFLRCSHCSYKTRRKHFYDVHQANHDQSIKVFTCTTCHMRFLCSESLDRHLAVHNGEPHLFECSHCPNKFRKKSAFDVHQAKHDSSIVVFRCDLCCQKFLSKMSLERHRLRHKGYKCPHCDFVAQKRWNYENHLFAVHEVNCSGKPLAKIKCPECDFSCVYEARLRYHRVAKHSGQKPFRCEHAGCDFASGTKSDVNKHHKAVHLKIRPYLCDSCGFCTVSQSQLDKHKRSHSGLKPHTCHICNKSYASVYTLKEHVRMHTNHEKPHVCHVCGRRYNRREHLNRHLKSVHKSANTVSVNSITTNNSNSAVTLPSVARVVDTSVANVVPAQFLPWNTIADSNPSLRPPDAGGTTTEVNLHCSYGGVVDLQRSYM